MDQERDIDREQPEGVRGGAASYAVPYPAAAAREAVTMARVQWNTVWAGVIVALAAQLVISSLVFALILTFAGPMISMASLGIWMSAVALVSLYVGGFLSTRMANVAGRSNALVHGAVVWGVAMLFGSIAANIGISGILGYNGILPTAPFGALRALPLAMGTAMAGTWWFFIGAALSLITACIGAVVGAKMETETPTTGT